jgi:hypothetical protein
MKDMDANAPTSNSAFRRSMGLELAGPHSERTALVVIDEYLQGGRLVVSHVIPGLGASEEKNSDTHLASLIRELGPGSSENVSFVGLATQAPLSLPPFFKNTQEKRDESRWLEDLWARTKPKPRPYLNYLNRPLDVWMRYFTPERFQMPEAMGANLAPLAARLQALVPDLPQPLFETFPRASLARIVSSSGLNRFWPKLYTDAEKGLVVREEFLERLLQLCPQIFLYDGDLETLVVDLPAFQAFLSAFSLLLHSKAQCDPKPDSFPESATWLLLPRQKIRWDDLTRPSSR